MKLTNNFNLPQTFINVIHRPTYSKGDAQISATEIMNAPRIVQLKHKHWEDLEQDAADMVWQIFGSAVHGVLEHGKDEHHIVEERLFTEFDGWKISGAIDLQEVYEDGIVINDYKVTGAWSVMNEKQDWMHQLNIYAWMIERVKQTPVKALNIIAIVRDWSRRDAATRQGYPSAPVVTIPIKMLSNEEREEYIRKRLAAHNEAVFSLSMDGSLPDCTVEDMWEKPTTYALKKEGNVRAKSVHATAEEAAKAFDGLKDPKGYFVEERPGERTRCASFCQVSKYCSQYQEYLHDQAVIKDTFATEGE